ncbi:hypothetical protein GJAV_G00021620 [Gymnothorax javanicus]|nr:hypothetical protein GJAV_G00021620 [Gymnothorax javanicus]
MSEQSICQARASVMVYDDTSKKWVPVKCGQQGFSRINIYHNASSNAFRVVGIKMQDQQVVINYSIVKGLKYNQATPTFHQWRDARQVYGLNFASKEEATTFSNAMLFALNVLNSQDGGPGGQRQIQNGLSADDAEGQRRVMELQQMQVETERRTSASGPAVPPGHLSIALAAHPIPEPAPASVGGPPPPPSPPGPPPASTGAVPPPPPLPASEGPGGQGEEAPSGLAAALAGAKLRRVHRSEEGSSASSAKSDASKGGGLMDEMNALLARRRKAATETEKAEDRKEDDGQNEDTNSPVTRLSGQPSTTDPVKRPWDRANSTDKSSLVSRVRPVGSSSDTEALEFDKMKQEILDEVVRELHKVKDEIIDAIRHELSRISTT